MKLTEQNEIKQQKHSFGLSLSWMWKCVRKYNRHIDNEEKMENWKMHRNQMSSK